MRGFSAVRRLCEGICWLTRRNIFLRYYPFTYGDIALRTRSVQWPVQTQRRGFLGKKQRG
ncbi:Uncharacterised protein [Serratia grimesii]|nr:Uncharacterised protein [Serratia grimesii]